MRFKVGDRVRIKSIDWYNENKDKDGNIRYKRDSSAYPIFFTRYMSRFCGETLIIKCVHKESYYMNETGSCEFWTDEMIEGLVEEEIIDIDDFQDDNEIIDVIEEYVHRLKNNECQINLPEGYQFTDENGNVINATKIVLEKKKKEYPKTYEECLSVLGIYNGLPDVEIYNAKPSECTLFESLIRLKRCRNAYWKIAGEEMGLNRPWKPDWEDEYQEKYIIGSWLGTIQGLEENFVSHPLAFPTEEMRDAFYENFKEEIEICKELL